MGYPTSAPGSRPHRTVGLSSIFSGHPGDLETARRCRVGHSAVPPTQGIRVDVFWAFMGLVYTVYVSTATATLHCALLPCCFVKLFVLSLPAGLRRSACTPHALLPSS